MNILTKNSLYCRNGVERVSDILDKKITVIALSLVLAIMLWLYVVTEQNPVIRKELSLPVRLINIDALAKNDLILLNNETFNVSITLRGNKNYLDSLNRTTVSASADLKEVNTKGLIELPVDLSGIPVGVEVSWISSNKLALDIDNIVSQVLPISLKIIGNTLQGTATMSPIVNPSEVEVKGAESIINTIKRAEASVNINHSGSIISEKVNVVIIDVEENIIEGLLLSPAMVDVVIPIENTKTVTIEADYRIIPAEGYILTGVSINPKTVNIVGQSSLLDDVTKLVTERIDISDARSSIDQKITLILPDGIELVNKNESIVFTATIEKVVEAIIESGEISIRNLSDDLEVEIPGETIKAVIRGTESIISSWNKDNTFYVDLKDLVEGEHIIPVFIEGSNQVELIDLFPNEIKVILRKKG